MTEIWNAYDSKRKQLPHLLIRGEPIPQGQFHLCVNVLVRHEDGDFLVMRRSASKSLYPRYWELGAGGSVLAGETSQEAALRELREETGLLADKVSLLEQFSSPEDQCHFDFYLAQVSGAKEDIRYQAGETEAHLWLPASQLIKFLDQHLSFQDQKAVVKKLLD